MASPAQAKKVGIFFIIGMVILGLITFRVEQIGRFFKRHNEYKAFFQGSKGLKRGSKVSLSGMDVGEVREVTVEDGKILVNMGIERDIPIREGSLAVIVPDFLFGRSYVDISLVPPDRPILPPGSVIKGVDVPGFSDMLVRFDEAMSSIELLTDTLESAKTILVRLEKGEGAMGKLFTDDEIFDELKGAVTNANDIMGKMARGEGTMGKLLEDDELFEDLKETVNNANFLLAKVSKGEGTMGKLFMDEELFEELTSSVENANILLGKLVRGEGTLGKLMRDEDLYEDLQNMMANLTETVNGFRAIMPHGAFSSVIYSSF
ncbi:MAG: MlaD family protein [Planctomycetota bacterium]|jgi:phospholipid/cholesterol/gamma-HCH transport system substrate-binding protein